jgi:hypothetical protein
MEFCLMFGEAAGLSRRRQSLPYDSTGAAAQPLSAAFWLEVFLHTCEKSDERTTNLVHDHNDSDTDAGGDETIFNGRHAGFIVQKREELGHDLDTPGTELVRYLVLVHAEASLNGQSRHQVVHVKEE